jgi:hypothetical protein
VWCRSGGGPQENPELYYHAEDFILGQTINVLGRPVLLRACDAFTRTFYREVLDIEQPEPLHPEIVETVLPTVRTSHPTPTHPHPYPRPYPCSCASVRACYDGLVPHRSRVTTTVSCGQAPQCVFVCVCTGSCVAVCVCV